MAKTATTTPAAETTEVTETATERKNRLARDRRAAKKAAAEQAAAEQAADEQAPTEQAPEMTEALPEVTEVETPEEVVVPEARAETPLPVVPDVPEVAPVPVPTGRTIKHTRKSALSNDQKRDLSLAIIRRVADMVATPEVDPTVTALLMAGVPLEGIAQQVANWMDLMPGAEWDSRLPNPQHRVNKKRAAAQDAQAAQETAQA